MAIDPREMMSPRERLVYNVNMRTHNADGATAPPSANFVREDTAFFGEDGFGFDDFLDIINPLQHLPLISLVYRELTGDEISAGARVVGGGLFGGPVGAMVGAAEAAIAGATGGEDLAVVAWNAITGEDEAGEPEAATTPAGEIEVAAATKPWIDPDTLPLPGQAAQPANAASMAPVMSPKPSQSPPPAANDAIPELTQDQVALLLSSVGLQPEAEAGDDAAPEQRAAEPASPASLIEPAAAPMPQPQRIADRDVGLRRNGLGPMKQTYIRPPANSDFVRHAPITEEMRTHMSTRSAPLSDEDQAWVVEAMAAALDKYRNGKAVDQAREAKGTVIDAAH